MAKASEAKRTKSGVVYRGKKYPGFNKPKRYTGKGKYKKTVLAKKGDQINNPFIFDGDVIEVKKVDNKFDVYKYV